MWVAGLGQVAAGDDGVGLRVIELLMQADLPEGVSLHRLADPVELVPLLGTGEAGVVVDAVLAAPPGVTRVLTEDELDPSPSAAVSSHGLSVLQAVRLARAIHPAVLPVTFVAIQIAAPTAHHHGLSPDVEAGALEAAALVLAAAQAGGITTLRP